MAAIHAPIKLTLAGATALVAGPALALAGIAISPTMSDDAGDQVTALTDHRAAVVAGLTLQTVGAVLLIAGMAWLAWAVGRSAAKLAAVGGILGIGGMLVVVFENGVAAAIPAIAGAVDHATATSIVSSIRSGATAALEPLSIFGDVGLAILGIAAAKAGAARWTPVAIAVGAFGGGAGFATGTRPLLLVAFSVLVVGLAGAGAALVPAPRSLIRAHDVAALAG